MQLKDKISQILALKKYTYGALADYLGLSERELDTALETKALEVRVLEVISKELHVPLYSFFREPFNAEEVLAEFKDVKNRIVNSKEYLSALRSELLKIKAEMAAKDELIKKLQDQLANR